METFNSGNEEIAALFGAMSKPDTLEILILAGRGIGNSTHAIDELDITPKRYYSRLKDLIEAGLLKKINGIYRQTPLGNIICNRFLPAMGRVCDAKDKLGLLVHFEGTQIENGVRKLIIDELDIPDFLGSPEVRIVGDYEALVIDAIDLFDSAEESILMASNYFDVRVMQASFRNMKRGVVNRIIAGNNSLSSKLKQLRMMISLTFAKDIIDVASNDIDLKEFVKFADLNFTFCVVDGCHCMIIISNIIKDEFVLAFSVEDRFVGEKLTGLFEEIWKTGDYKPTFEFLSWLKKT